MEVMQLSNGKTVYLETMGCQMNVLDSELVMGQLLSMGYAPTKDIHAADLVLLNTCSVRQHAEDKAFSRLGELKKTKRHRPEMIVGVIGCMVERNTDGIVEKMPHVDLLCGPGELHKIPALLAEVGDSTGRAVALSGRQSRKIKAIDRALLYDSLEILDAARGYFDGAAALSQSGMREVDRSRRNRCLQAYIRVQRGCDKFCSFCVVPAVRGAERSRAPQAIVDEAKMLADRGAKEVTLLGQTVNSYVHRENGRPVRFADLLERVHAVDGLERIRFVTSYPGDFTDDILEAMRDLPKVCEYLHIPAQSGSSAVLRRMKRQYTAEEYMDLMHRACEYVPGIGLAGDFIVGFCGETEEDFEKTVQMVRAVEFQNLFVFKYSPRPQTVADRGMADDVPDQVKRRRNHDLLRVQEEVSLRANTGMISRTVEVLVEGYSKAALKAQDAEQGRGDEASWRRGDQLVGRTRTDQVVVFNGDESLISRLVPVRITAATALTLHGEVITGSADDHEAARSSPADAS